MRKRNECKNKGIMRKHKSNKLIHYASKVKFFLILVHKGCKIVENYFPVALLYIDIRKEDGDYVK